MAFDAPLLIERSSGRNPGTRILSLTGPLTLRNLFELQTELRSGELPARTIFDMGGVPYMDSAGMGLVINHFVHCQNRQSKLVVAGVSQRVLELFRMTRVDTVIPQFATVAEADGD